MRLLALLLLCVATLAAAEPAAPQAADAVIYPGGSGEKPAVTAGHDGWSRAPWLAGTLLLAAAGTWFFWRSRGRVLPGRAAGRKLVIEETHSFGNRQYLIVAAYEGKKVLLGVTPDRIKLLCALGEDQGDRL